MQVKEKSFFQTTAGVVTGVAGILTAIVGLLTVGVQLGWLSSKSSSPSASTTGSTANASSPANSSGALGTPTTSRASSAAGSGSSGTSATAPQFTVDPPAVTFENLGPRDQEVTISNTGSSSLTFLLPTVTGTNANRFTVADETCGSGLSAGGTCQIKVTFAPSGPGTSTATLLIKPTVGPNREVPLKGTSLL